MWRNAQVSRLLAPLVQRINSHGPVQWSEDVVKAASDPLFGRSPVRFRVPPWVSNTIIASDSPAVGLKNQEAVQ